MICAISSAWFDQNVNEWIHKKILDLRVCVFFLFRQERWFGCFVDWTSSFGSALHHSSICFCFHGLLVFHGQFHFSISLLFLLCAQENKLMWFVERWRFCSSSWHRSRSIIHHHHPYVLLLIKRCFNFWDDWNKDWLWAGANSPWRNNGLLKVVRSRENISITNSIYFLFCGRNQFSYIDDFDTMGRDRHDVGLCWPRKAKSAFANGTETLLKVCFCGRLALAGF